MLKGIHPLLNADLLHALASMGHGVEIAIVDANFPAVSMGQRVIALTGASAPEALAAILTVLPLDIATAPTALTMPPCARTILTCWSRLAMGTNA